MSVLESYARLRGERSAVPRPRPATEDRMRRLPPVQHSARAWVRRTVVLLMVIESLAAGAVGTVQISADRTRRGCWSRVAPACSSRGRCCSASRAPTRRACWAPAATSTDASAGPRCSSWHWPASSPTRAAWTSRGPSSALSRSSPWSPSSTGSPPVSGCASCGHVGGARAESSWSGGGAPSSTSRRSSSGSATAACRSSRPASPPPIRRACRGARARPAPAQERVRRARDLPVAGLDDVLALAAEHGADTVAVTSASETAAEYLRKLSWQLEGTGLELLVAPGLVEVAGPRLHIRPFEGLPFLSVEQPRFEGWQRVVKGGMDRLLAGTALVLLAPLLLAIAVAVRASSPGSVLYQQERVGLGGTSFTMLKFRSMVADADQQRATLQEQNISDGLLFKIRNDPRVTPVGRWLRRHSLDELPQLINVLTGSMSLVGPRPPLPGEVARYDSSVSRRLLVKPGLTGLWQISGRSDLPWEEAVRLDLRYVENWSLALDALILWKTGRAVLSSSGAY